jgi:hypothetical protein
MKYLPATFASILTVIAYLNLELGDLQGYDAAYTNLGSIVIGFFFGVINLLFFLPERFSLKYILPSMICAGLLLWNFIGVDFEFDEITGLIGIPALVNALFGFYFFYLRLTFPSKIS